MNGYTKADNWLWDYVMPRAKPNTFKIVAAVVRMTAGWHQDVADITYSDFHEMTGIVSRTTLINAIDDALSEGFICRRESGRSFTYGTETVPIDGTEMIPTRYRNDTDDGTETVPMNGTKPVPPDSTTKERKEKKPKETTPSNSGLDFGDVATAYQNEIGDFTKIISDDVGDAVDEFGPQTIMDAIHIAAKQNKRSWAYVDGILSRWRREGKGGKPKSKARDDPKYVTDGEFTYELVDGKAKRIEVNA